MNHETRIKRTGLTLIGILLACLVAVATMSALSIPVFTEEAETFCGHEEHKHDSDCYTKELTCGKEETEGHTHSDACYEEQVVQTDVLICGLEETPAVEGHTHTDACYEDKEVTKEVDGEEVVEVERVLKCTLEETPSVEGHTHSDACYETTTEKVLVCGKEESDPHKHSKDCYEKVLTCDKEEHKHKEECYCDTTADVESAATWEATLPQELSGVWADDVIKVAESQLGYTESKRNFQPGPGRRLGYTRYGAWYGNAYGDWCAMFVSFCLNYANIPTTAMPRDASCPNWVSTLKTKDMFYPAHGEKAYVPVKGDIIFFDWEGDGTVDHVGLVVGVDQETKTIKTIEGNSGDVVQYCTYPVNSGEITGYGKLPVNPDDPVVKAREAEQVQNAEDAIAGSKNQVTTAARGSVESIAEAQTDDTSAAATMTPAKRSGSDKRSAASDASSASASSQAAGTYVPASGYDAAAAQGDGYSTVTAADGTMYRLEDEAQIMTASQMWAAILPGGSAAE